MPPTVGSCRRDPSGEISRYWSDDSREIRGYIRTVGGIRHLVQIDLIVDEDEAPGIAISHFPNELEMFTSVRTAKKAEDLIESVLSDYDEIVWRRTNDL